VGDRIDLRQPLRSAIGNTVVACCCYGELPRESILPVRIDCGTRELVARTGVEPVIFTLRG
jgi:hypothetical protein